MKIYSVLITLVLYLILDMFWFQFSLPSYKKTVKGIQSSDMNVKYLGTVAWLFLAIGMVYFVLPNVKTRNDALRLGALYGFVVYGVFNGTNYAMFKNWDINISVIDTLWGIFVSSMVAYLSTFFL